MLQIGAPEVEEVAGAELVVDAVLVKEVVAP